MTDLVLKWIGFKQICLQQVRSVDHFILSISLTRARPTGKCRCDLRSRNLHGLRDRHWRQAVYYHLH